MLKQRAGTKGRWKEPALSFKPELNIPAVTKRLRDRRCGRPFFRHLTVEREVRVCIRYLTDEDYRLTKIAQEIRTRPANLREMFTVYGVDVQNRTLVAEMQAV